MTPYTRYLVPVPIQDTKFEEDYDTRFLIHESTNCPPQYVFLHYPSHYSSLDFSSLLPTYLACCLAFIQSPLSKRTWNKTFCDTPIYPSIVHHSIYLSIICLFSSFQCLPPHFPLPLRTYRGKSSDGTLFGLLIVIENENYS